LFIRDNLLSHTPNTVLKGLVEVHTLAITPNSCKEGTQEKHFFILQRTPEEEQRRITPMNALTHQIAHPLGTAQPELHVRPVRHPKVEIRRRPLKPTAEF